MLLEDFRHSKFFTTSTSANQLRNFGILIKPLSLFVKYSSLQTTSKKFRLQQHEVFHHLEKWSALWERSRNVKPEKNHSGRLQDPQALILDVRTSLGEQTNITPA